MSARTRRRPIRWPVIPLGLEGLTMVYYAIGTGTIIRLGPTQHTETYFETIASEKEWRNWMRYRNYERINYARVSDRLKRMCRHMGAFDPDKVRGIGAWKDCGRLIYNAGSVLFVDGVRYSRRVFANTVWSRYVYTQGKRATLPAEEEATAEEVRAFVEAQTNWNWQNKSVASRLIVGATATAFLSATLPWRPMLLITGPTHCGKTTHSEITRRVLGPLAHYQLGSTTEAGLRQKLAANGDARPVVFDEFEKANNDTQQAIIELMRIAASPSDGTITKGTKEQRPITQRIHSMGIFYGVNAPITLAQDRSRWVILRLDDLPPVIPESVTRHSVTRIEAIETRFAGEFGSRLLRRMLNRWQEFGVNFGRFRRAILGYGRDARLADVYGVLLAGWWTATNDECVPREAAQLESEFVKYLDTGEQEAGMAVLDHLRTYRLNMQYPGGALGRSVALWISDLQSVEYPGPDRKQVEAELASIGVRVEGDHVLIATSPNTGIGRVYRDTLWSDGGHADALRRIGAKSDRKGRSFDSVPSKALHVPLATFLGSEAEGCLDHRSSTVEATVEA